MEEQTKFKVGDVVVLNSEPNIRMTVVDILAGDVLTLWFSGYELTRGQFPEAALTVV
jgi:uncharacterized protein YodC (DUF2158 family)